MLQGAAVHAPQLSALSHSLPELRFFLLILFCISRTLVSSKGMPAITPDMLQKRAELVRTGGRGSVRRTMKAHHKNSGDDKKVQGTLRRLGVTPFNDIDEVVFYRQDGSTFFFNKPRVQASMQTQCFVVSGDYEVKSAEEVDSKKE